MPPTPSPLPSQQFRHFLRADLHPGAESEWPWRPHILQTSCLALHSRFMCPYLWHLKHRSTSAMYGLTLYSCLLIFINGGSFCATNVTRIASEGVPSLKVSREAPFTFVRVCPPLPETLSMYLINSSIGDIAGNAPHHPLDCWLRDGALYFYLAYARFFLARSDSCGKLSHPTTILFLETGRMLGTAPTTVFRTSAIFSRVTGVWLDPLSSGLL